MRKSIKILLSSFLAASQLSCYVPYICAASEKSKNSNQQSTILTYAKNAVLLPVKGAWWLAKANLTAAAVAIGDFVVSTGTLASTAGVVYCLNEVGVINADVRASYEGIKETIDNFIDNGTLLRNQLVTLLMNSNINEIRSILDQINGIDRQTLTNFLDGIQNLGAEKLEKLINSLSQDQQ